MKIIQTILSLPRLLFGACGGRRSRANRRVEDAPTTTPPRTVNLAGLPALFQSSVVLQLSDKERLVLAMTNTTMMSLVMSALPVPREFTITMQDSYEMIVKIERENTEISELIFRFIHREYIDKNVFRRAFLFNDVEYFSSITDKVIITFPSDIPHIRDTICAAILSLFRGSHKLNLDIDGRYAAKFTGIVQMFKQVDAVSLNNGFTRAVEVYTLLRKSEVRHLTVNGFLMGHLDLFLNLEIYCIIIEDQDWFCTSFVSHFRCHSLFVSRITCSSEDILVLMRLWQNKEISEKLKLFVFATKNPIAVTAEHAEELDAVETSLLGCQLVIKDSRLLKGYCPPSITLSVGLDVTRSDGKIATMTFWSYGLVIFMRDDPDLNIEDN